jgi:ubiquinone/menaquinone biosynthesis C-methylase UbiE
MSQSQPGELKQEVRAFWNQQSCDTQVAIAERFSKEYFEQIEQFRYFDQPFIHSFAQFSRYRGKKVVEVGFGAGTDFIQWLRAGAIASGIDLTPEALANLTHRVEIYNLPAPAKIQVSDAEQLPFESNTFDLGYSFGVLHHTPNTPKAVSELIRVVRPGGEVKIMLYNSRSIYIINQWIRHCLLKGKPWKSLNWVLWNHIESAGTKGYTRKELLQMLAAFPLERIQIHTEVTAADYLSSSAFAPLKWVNHLALRLAGDTYGWKPQDYVERGDRPKNVTDKDSRYPLFTGNRLGFFHCISARKR